MILQARHTHLYPGLRGRLAGVTQAGELEPAGDCVVEFSDGTAAAATVIEEAKDWRLRVDAYRTAAGTCIATKHWLMRIEGEGNKREFRILARATDQP